MPEILTESFCERCGTRYTFESAAPRKTRRIGKFKTLSKGMKNWVMSDDTSLDEAMAAARNDEERELTSHQLDAFHSTFNFCMTCRQYTCGNCWNAAEGRCLTCAPNLGHEILPAPFPDQVQFDPIRIEAESWPEVDLTVPGVAAEANGHGHVPDNGLAVDENDPWASAGAADRGDIPDFDPAARLAFLSGETPAPVVEAEAVEAEAVETVEVEAEVVETVEVEAEVVEAEAEVVEVEPEAVEVEPEAVAAALEPALAVAELELTVAEPLSAAVEPGPVAAADRGIALAPTVEGRARAGSARTSDLLRRFRPGQNIDAELAAYEAGLADATIAAQPEPVAAEPEPVVAEAEPEPVAVAEPVEVAEPVAAAEPEPVHPEPVEAPEVEPVAAAAPEPEPIEPPQAAEPAREDRIEQPTWRIFAPDQSTVPGPADQPRPATPRPSPLSASAEPQWPARPDIADSPAMSLLANRGSGSPSDALWAASAQEVLAAPVVLPVAGAPTGVQPCSNCGLSLSATARFCRRCGSRQG